MSIWVKRIVKYALFLALLALITVRGLYHAGMAARWESMAGAATGHEPELTMLALKAKWMHAAGVSEKRAVVKSLYDLKAREAFLHFGYALEKAGEADASVLAMLLLEKIGSGVPVGESDEGYYEVERLAGLLEEQDPRNMLGIEVRANLLYARSTYDPEALENAIQLLDRVVKQRPENTQALTRLAHLYARAGRSDAAEEVRAGFVRRVGRKNPLALLISAEILIHLGRHEQAGQELEQALREAQGDATVPRQVGELYMRMGQYKPALDCWEGLLKAKGDDPEIHAYRALAHLLAGRPRESEAAVEEGMKALAASTNKDGSSPRIVYLRAYLALRGGMARLALREQSKDEEERKALLAKAREAMAPEFSVAGLRWLRETVAGYLALVDGRLEAAHTAFDRALRSGPNRSEILFIARLAASTSLALAQPGRTLQLSSEILAVAPEDKRALLLQAEALLALGRPTEAQQVAKQLLAKEPENEAYQKILSTALAMDGHKEELQRLARVSGIPKEQVRALFLLKELRANPAVLRELRGLALADPNLGAMAVRELLQTGKAPLARELLDALIEKHPEHTRLLMLKTLVSEPDLDRRIERLAELIRKEHDEGYARQISLARLYLDAGDAARARDAFNTALEARPDDVHALRQLYQLHGARAQWEEAERYLGLLKKLNADGLNGALLESELKIARRDFEGARTVLSRALEEHPDHAQALLVYANVQSLLGDLQASRGTLDRSLRANPNYIPALMSRAAINLKLGAPLAAETDLKRAYTIDRTLVQAPEILAGLRLKDGKPDEAMKILAEAEEHGLRSAILYQLKVRTFLDSGRFKEAGETVGTWTAGANLPPAVLAELVGALKRAYREKADEVVDKWADALPDDPVPGLLQAALLLEARNLERVQTLVDALKGRLSPDSPHRGFLLKLEGGLAMERSDWASAVQSYRALLDLIPGDLMALNNLAYVLGFHLSRPEEAILFARRATVANPESPEVWDTYGVVLAKAGRLEEAERALFESLKLRPRSVTLLSLARLRLQQDRREEARKEGRKALELAEKETASPGELEAIRTFLEPLK